METASQSGDRELAEDLLGTEVFHHVEMVIYLEVLSIQIHTFLCNQYDLIRPDVVLELGWINSTIDFLFPYLLQGKEDIVVQSVAFHESSKVDRRLCPFLVDKVRDHG
ncbi:hypothetical protein V6N11_052633 [Hibiscus sabdariffa]|uniref:Uncharacterized protein n=1 Tax=Hibiscus sabdariffa TaxID=183260 RepID=A0ABR2UAM0_9ROSI